MPMALFIKRVMNANLQKFDDTMKTKVYNDENCFAGPIDTLIDGINYCGYQKPVAHNRCSQLRKVESIVDEKQ